MTGTIGAVSPLPSTVLRWSARGLSLALLLFWGYFGVAHIFGDAGSATRPLVVRDYIILATLAASLAGLAAAWKWEFAGAVVTILFTLACAAANPLVLVFPGPLFLAVAGLFLASAWMGRSRTVTAVSTAP